MLSNRSREIVQDDKYVFDKLNFGRTKRFWRCQNKDIC